MGKFGARFVLCRSIAGLSQNEAAKRIGVAQSTLSNYEAGLREPSMKALVGMADTYGVSIDFLLSRSDETDLPDGTHMSLTSRKKGSSDV